MTTTEEPRSILPTDMISVEEARAARAADKAGRR